jgi:hypothetical protein
VRSASHCVIMPCRSCPLPTTVPHPSPLLPQPPTTPAGLQLLQSSSPSYLLMASLDAATAYATQAGVWDEPLAAAQVRALALRGELHYLLGVPGWACLARAWLHSRACSRRPACRRHGLACAASRASAWWGKRLLAAPARATAAPPTAVRHLLSAQTPPPPPPAPPAAAPPPAAANPGAHAPYQCLGGTRCAWAWTCWRCPCRAMTLQPGWRSGTASCQSWPRRRWGGCSGQRCWSSRGGPLAARRGEGRLHVESGCH